ncbi:MAG: acyl carrier protein [bacterium]|nr:acyl carrier protein [bacterium]
MAVTEKEVVALVRMQMGVRKVSMGQRFMEDLGAESADLVNLIAAAEDKYHIAFDEKKIAAIRTVGELYELIRELKS